MRSEMDRGADHEPFRSRLIFIAMLSLVVGLKIATLAAFWDFRLGDFSRFVAFADAILESSAWLKDGGIAREALPPELWKTPGYPLLIAAAKLALGEGWPHAIMVLNSILSLIAGLFVRRLGFALGFGAIATNLAFLLFEFSVPASTDVLLMPDGLYGCLATIIVCWIGARILMGRELSIATMSAAGLLVFLCFFVREGFLYLMVLVGLALVVPAVLTGIPVRRAIILLVVFCLPALFAAGAILTWNRYRTGEYMIANVNQVVLLTAILKVAEKDKSVFGGDTPLDRVARETFSDFDYGDAQNIDLKLFRDHGIQAPEASRITQQKYWQVVTRHTGAYLATMLDRFRFRQQASMTGDLLMRLDDLEYWRLVNYQHDYYGGWRARAERLLATRDPGQLDAQVLLNMVPRAMARGASIILFLLFVVGVPILVWRDGFRSGDPVRRQRAAFLASLYVFYWAVFAIYLLVNVEIRYLGPICAVPILGALFVARRIPFPRRRRAALTTA